MLNSAEEQSYWYLRLNGFFPLGNFVIHKSKNVEYSSDADLLAIRTPFVYEEIGGTEADWDKKLLENFDADALIGIICQVKGGTIGNKELFREPYLSYCVQRLGLTTDVNAVLQQFENSPIATITNSISQKIQIAKLLITRDRPMGDGSYLVISLDWVSNFITERIKKYPNEKYRDRNFFSSIGLQTIIENFELENRKGTDKIWFE